MSQTAIGLEGVGIVKSLRSEDSASSADDTKKNMDASVRARRLAISKANSQVLLLAVAMMSAMSACVSHVPVAPAQPVTVAMAAAPPEAPPQILPSTSPSPENKMEMHAAGEELYRQRCAMCHDAGRAPPRSQIAQLSRKEIREALDTGFMAAISQFMTPQQQSLLVWHLSENDIP